MAQTDVAKYMTTAVLISAIFTDLKEQTPGMAYIGTALLTCYIFLSGMYLVALKKEREDTDE